MAETYSTELDGVLNPTTEPASKADGAVYEGRTRNYRASITLASQASGDTIVLAKPPAGSVFSHGIATTDTSLATATFSVGSTDDPDGMRADAVLTATDTPEVFGTIAGISTEGALDGDTEVKLTIATASFPASGTLVIDLVFVNK